MPDPDPDPRPIIAAKLDTTMMARLLGNPDAVTILDEEIPEGAPWSVDRDPPLPELIKCSAGGVTLWLCRHPEAVASDPYLADWSPYA